MATVLQVDNLARSYGEKNLFEGISFVISQYQKVALIARNGAGKTSLLNIIAGIEQSDGGTCQIFSPFTMQYLLQEPQLTDSNTVFEEVYLASNEVQKTILNYEHVIKGGDKKEIEQAIARMDTINGWDYEVRIRQILTQLKLPDLDQPVRELSGGQQKRVALAKILITEPDFIILDEPTNHLDVEMIEWLEEYLSQRSLTIFMVTHDRYFLDRVCDEILEMEKLQHLPLQGQLFVFPGEAGGTAGDTIERDREGTQPPPQGTGLDEPGCRRPALRNRRHGSTASMNWRKKPPIPSGRTS